MFAREKSHAHGDLAGSCNERIPNRTLGATSNLFKNLSLLLSYKTRARSSFERGVRLLDSLKP